ncbi:hypothetical protein A3C20_02975 [Candidatus Kaiserbacteria bacterium RIFCSPHIGHO2_02_FULL_55_25]|uniref:ABC transporter domain-containing protein n=1 Tax=Candidatus Kaiserbacteria bacterium RIFCSPHIGHO2_02_FULL_55_25 TaxID=1798498 RepID=A0A1F6E7R2_9BACT|nr:MAG: hypothetical protein A2764_01110 [Candidatus Kaiserbacteria bacterium RIFCSPHIGHO2_01_FULL_55_79]OGG69232.1 MAG: hypothetical protein A3C20_02975 [Candidatus Kaiserbacteria bacterium RIFCSPHIGHO2_02_FULL_55_25]OGG83633.1 MAG: hypothetical protein A3A42_00455 [Candidatus Kaiserbacteria bacterium RIFCSPLOWO2_01_FULL_55_25]
MQKEILFSLQNAAVHYGGVKALQDVTVRVEEGEIVALMGPNGAGKSTVLKTIFGLVQPVRGNVLWHGQKIHPKPYEMAGRGISYVPQGRQVFKNLTVYENLELGGYALAARNDLKGNIESALRLFPALQGKLREKAASLSGGQQQMLTIARGLVSDPKVLLLDEPSLGLAPKIVKEVFEKIREIHEQRKIAVVIIEHSIKSVLAIAQRVYVLAEGKIAFDGTPDTLKSDTLERIFLGQNAR